MAMFSSVLFGLGLLAICMVLHELGHLLAALAFGLRVPRLSIGIGPLLLGVRSTGTEWRIVLPVLGERRLFTRASTPRRYELRALFVAAFVDIPALRRARLATVPRVVVFLAGPLANFVTSVLAFAVVIRMSGGGWSDVITAPLVVFRLLAVVVHTATPKDLTGPIGMISLLSSVSGARETVGMIAIMSAQLFAFNLLPLVPLDGGNIAVALYARARRRPLNACEQRVVGTVAAGIGLTFLVALIALDVSNLVGWR